jgi:hypothetical protein
MSRPLITVCAITILLIGFLGRIPDGWSDPPAKKRPSASTKAPAKPEPAKAPRPAASLGEKLFELVNLPNGIAANTPLRDALESLAERHECTILLDNAAFKEEGVENVEDQPVRLPRLSGVRLDTVLRRVAAQVYGVPLVRGDHLEITTAQRAAKNVWGTYLPAEESDQPGRPRRALPLVHASFAGIPLQAALRDLMDQAGASIVLDAMRSGELARAPVTAKLDNVPLDSAVRLLAGQADLRVVVLDNVLYVTTPQHAQTLREEQEHLAQGEGRTPEMVLTQQLRQPVDLNLKDTPFNTAVKMMARETGLKIVIDRRVEEQA